MNKIFIDLGCYDGDSIREFYRWIPDAKDWDIYACDPNPRFESTWTSMMRENPKLIVERKAAWFRDGTIEYTLRPEDAPLGSTVMKAKADWGMGTIIHVPSFDLSAFLRRHEGRFIMMKMDIEGAEYLVLRHLIETDTIDLIGELKVEWHADRLGSVYQELEKRIKEQLEERRILWTCWV